ncbi:Integrin alpha-M CD11 antigen-like family member B [Larimichthys crocea]|uniref:Integrin alpha-M CD11 antigen-like family member B n=1 Tax=Larimichthys crocea TaxID=215358 RepID=A0A6G0HYX8_LARCR|nr:Integrin alpha-M CD11 antigen-like family member B [Larimichthys crocea]
MSLGLTMTSDPITQNTMVSCQDVFSPYRGARPNVKRVLIVITDGESSDSQNDLRGATNLAENAKIVRFAIGVGSAFDKTDAKEELKTIASSPPDEHVFQVGNFDALERIRNSLQEKIFAIEGSETDGESLKLEMSQEGFSAAYVPEGFQMGIVGANQWKGGYMKYTSSGMKSGSYEPLNVESVSYLASARINCNFTLDSTRKAPNNRAYISEKQRMTNKSVDLDLRQPKCFDVNFFVERCPQDALNALSNELTFTFEGLPSERLNLSPSLALKAQTTTFHPLGFEFSCGTDNNCVDNLKVDFNFTRSLEVKVGIDELLDVSVSVENSEENSYNSHVIVTYPAGLSFRKFTILQDCSVAQCRVFKCNMFMGRLESKTLKISANLSSRWIQQIGLKSAKYLLTSTASLEYDRNQYIFFSTGSNNNPPIRKIEAEVEVYAEPDFTKEIVGGSLGGLALLALLTAGLYKAGFFKSKYNDMINAEEAEPEAPLAPEA